MFDLIIDELNISHLHVSEALIVKCEVLAVRTDFVKGKKR